MTPAAPERHFLAPRRRRHRPTDRTMRADGWLAREPRQRRAAPTPSATPGTGTSTGGTGDTTLPIIAALAIVAIAGVLLVTRGRRTPPAA